MSIADKKVTQTQLITYGVVSQPDVLQGTAAENKAVFDRLIREIVGSSLNPVIEELAGGTGAQTIGAQVAGMAGDNVQTLLNGLKTLVDNRYTKSESDALLAAGTNDLVETIEIDLETGIFTITKKDGTASSIDTAMEKIALDVCLDGTDFVLTLADGSEQRVSLAAFIDTYTFPESDTIAFSVAGTGNQKQVSASVRGSSITLSMLAPEVTSAVETAAESAQTSAQAAQEAKTAAQTAEVSAAQSKTQAQDAKTQAQAAATLAQSWAVGATGTRAGEDENNSKYYAQRAQAFSENSAVSAQGAASSAQAAQTQAQNAKDQADRAKSEADRASEIAGGDYATRSELAAKTDKVSGATSGNLAGLDANGNLTDSGKSAEDFVGQAELDGKADWNAGEQAGETVTLDIAEDTAAAVRVQGRTVETLADPAQEKSPDNPAAIAGVGESGSVGISVNQQTILTVPLTAPLYSLPDGVRDTLDLAHGKAARRIGKVVLDGTESWGESGDPNQTETFCALLDFAAVAKGSYYHAISDLLENKDIYSNDVEGIRTAVGTGAILIRILKSRMSAWSDSLTSAEKLALLKAWLAQNPVTVLYELAEPAVESLAACPELPRLYAPQSTVSCTDPVSPTLEVQACNTRLLAGEALEAARLTGPAKAELDGKASLEHTHTAEQVGAAPASHASDTTVHITASERTGWNGKAAAKSYTATLTAEGWSGTTAPYTQTASVTGIAEGDQPQIGPVYSATLATALLQQEAWNMVSKAVTAANSITFTCFTDKPATAIPVQIKVVK